MELSYTKIGDYYIPDLILPDEPGYRIGKYGRMRKQYLEEHHPGIYSGMVLTGKLCPHLAEIDRACNERMELIVREMANKEGVTEALKAADQMAWVGRINNIRNRAEEIILHELIYSK